MSAMADVKFASEGEQGARFKKRSESGDSLKEANRHSSTLQTWQRQR